jgi:[acyl-carrier-protein] S-malonyltransferase
MGIMEKVAFVFPGQGSQKIGMGKDFYERSDAAAKVYHQADRILSYKLSDLCFRGEPPLLSQTLFAQPCILTTSFAILEALRERGKITPSFVAGHSLGEYTALLAAEVIEFEAALRFVLKRACFMEEASEGRNGGMVAILGLKAEVVESICGEIQLEGEEGVVEVANFNSPHQVVITGTHNKLEKVVKRAREIGGKGVKLEVSGAFHSTLMRKASENLKGVIQNFPFREAKIPVVTNVWAEPISSPAQLKESLVRQVKSPVLWERSVRRMVDEGVTTFVEIGPGKVLAKLIHRITPGVKTFSIEDMESMDSFFEFLGGKVGLGD